MESSQEVLSERLRLKIAPTLSDRIDNFGVNVGLNRSEVVRAALIFFLNGFEKVDPEEVRKLIVN